VFAGDVGAVPLCSTRQQLDELCRIAETLAEVSAALSQPLPYANHCPMLNSPHPALCSKAHTLPYAQKPTHCPMLKSPHPALCSIAHTLPYAQ
jgi:hypothetical protein